MKVVIAAVMYSPNLGDGLIADCLTASLKSVRADLRVSWLDLAGRTEFTAPSSGLRTLVLDGLAHLPDRVSLPLAGVLVRRQIATRLAPHTANVMDGADLMIIGGGQLFGDANLNFPLKLAHVVQTAETLGVPFAIHGVGVAKHWTAQGRALFAKTLGSDMLHYISVRDDASAYNLVKHYADLELEVPCPVAVFPDPGLCADMLAEPVRKTETNRRNIGIGVVHPAALATHSAVGEVLGKSATCKAYVALAQKLSDSGCDVHLFTNGAGEDEDMLDTVENQTAGIPRVSRTARFSAPCDLVAFLQSMDAIASHRLHACIVANALGKTAVGFTWDTKIDAYFALTGQSAQLFTRLSDTDQVARALMSNLSNDVDATLQTLKPLVQDGARSVLGAIPAISDATAVA